MGCRDSRSLVINRVRLATEASPIVVFRLCGQATKTIYRSHFAKTVISQKEMRDPSKSNLLLGSFFGEYGAQRLIKMMNRLEDEK